MASDAVTGKADVVGALAGVKSAIAGGSDHRLARRCGVAMRAETRRRFLIRSTRARLTAYFAASSWDDSPASASRSTRVRKSTSTGPWNLPRQKYHGRVLGTSRNALA